MTLFRYFLLLPAIACFLMFSYIPLSVAEIRSVNNITIDDSESATLYTCPMHPHVLSHEPGSCPICGMSLVEKNQQQSIEPKAINQHSNKPVVSVSASMQQALGVKWSPVVRGKLSRNIRSFGEVAFDEEAINHVHSRVSGWVERLYAQSQGDVIKTGDRLYDIYSPQLHSAQKDYLLVLANGNEELQQSSENRLKYLGMNQKAIAELKRSRVAKEVVAFYAGSEGVVSQLNIRQGMYVEPGTNILSITRLSEVWVIAEVPPMQVSWLHEGLGVDLYCPAHPGHKWQGEIDYLYPQLDPVTRNLRIRIRFDNDMGLLRPGAVVDVLINSVAPQKSLLIPSSALIVTEQRKQVVKRLSAQQFQVIDVEVGASYQGKVQVTSGLDEGDQVVVRGQFLIDSESQLQEAISRFTAEGLPSGETAPSASTHQHGG